MKHHRSIWRWLMILALLFPPLFCGGSVAWSRFRESGAVVWKIPGGAFITRSDQMILMLGDFDTLVRSRNRFGAHQRLAARLRLDPDISEEEIESILYDTPTEEQIVAVAELGAGHVLVEMDLSFVKVIKDSSQTPGLCFVCFHTSSTLMLMASLSFSILAVLAIRRRVREVRIERGRCPVCGYDIRTTLSPRCPECGTPFDPATIGWILGRETNLPLEALWEEQK